MWVHTDLGFMSVVEYDPKKDPSRTAATKQGKKKYPHVSKRGSHVLVRARVKADLDDLKAYFPKLVVETDGAADYRFRAVLPKKVFAEFMSSKVMAINYDSHFKEVVEDRLGAAQGKAEGKLRHSKLMSIWSTMAALQPYGAYGVHDPSRPKYTAPSSSSSWSGGSSKYQTKGKYGTTYAEALGGDLEDELPLHSVTDSDLWDEVLDSLGKTVGYDEAVKRLGWDIDQLSVSELVEQLQENNWSLSLGAQSDFKDLSEDALEVYLTLVETYGEDSTVDKETVDEVVAQVASFWTDNRPEGEINSLPLDQPVN